MRNFVFCMVLLGALFFAPGTTQAADLSDGALGVPWGASPAQARQIMEQNGFTFSNQIVSYTGASGTGFTYKDGFYASYSSTVDIYFINNQMWTVTVKLFGGKKTEIFRDLNRLLTEKYGPLTSTVSGAAGDGKAGSGYGTRYDWKDVVAAGLNIDLVYISERQTSSSYIPDSVTVDYVNQGLYDKLKAQSRQNI